MNLEVSAVERRFSNRDLARLRTNDTRLANRFITINNITYPIVHLSIAEVDIFKALTEKLDSIFNALANNSFFDFLLEEKQELIDFLSEDVPIAASITLRLTANECKQKFKPITLLRVVIRQWLHNMEISKVQRLYPMPEDDEDSPDIDGQPSDNPCSMDERLCSNFHWTLEQAQNITFPQAYLISNESSWSYKKMKANSDNPQPKKKVAKAPDKKGSKRFVERFGNTPQEQRDGYFAYMQEHFGEVRIRSKS